MVRNNKKLPAKKRGQRTLLTVIAAIVVVALGVIFFFWHQSSDGDKNQTAATQKDTSPRPTTDKGGPSETPTQPTGNNTQTPPPTVNPNNLPVTAPSGSFVSNHKPGQNGSPQQESSVCITTPGASCEVTFTKAGVTKSLGVQTADSSGAAYWTAWTPQNVGLTDGSWTVSATATWGSQTAATVDPVALQVQL